MGFLSNLRAMKNVQKIKTGGTADFTLSQMVNLLINLPDASKNLSKQKFEEVHALYDELNKCSTKYNLDINRYYDLAVRIIRRFDQLAPYEKYSGGNEIEFSFLMDDIRNESTDETVLAAQKHTEIIFNDEDNKYMNYIVEQANGQICIDDAREIMKVMNSFHESGKENALSAFDELANKLIKENDPINAMIKISFLSGLLYPNRILTKNESDNLSKKYTDSLIQTVKDSIKEK